MIVGQQSPGREAIEFLGCRLHPWTMQETVGEIVRRIHAGVFTQHGAVNVAKLVHMRKDAVLREAIANCHIINADGMGVVWGARLLGWAVPERVAGVDLFHELLAVSAREGFSVFLLGATQEVVAETARRVQALYPDLALAGFHHGYFWDDEHSIVEKIRSSGADLLFVAITSPQKENFIHRWREQLGVKFVMGVGGTFDVVAGKVKRAPCWMQRAGLEWLYRLLQEPRRMWRRYLTTNLKFLWLLLAELWLRTIGRSR